MEPLKQLNDLDLSSQFGFGMILVAELITLRDVDLACGTSFTESTPCIFHCNICSKYS